MGRTTIRLLYVEDNIDQQQVLKSFVKGKGLPYEIAHICLAHSSEGDKLKRSPEAWIVHHCDFICFELAKLG